METIADQLRKRGVVRRGDVLLRMAERGQIIELRCEMPKCYCHKGRSHFDPRTHPQRSNWAPSADHYPQLQADGGKLVPWNVRLAHVFCNQEDWVWRGRIRRMLQENLSLEQIANALNDKGIRRPYGSAKWTAKSVRKAFVS
jgi:Recombinase